VVVSLLLVPFLVVVFLVVVFLDWPPCIFLIARGCLTLFPRLVTDILLLGDK
jgi:hypothetical protein